jgi:hypothetical protein
MTGTATILLPTPGSMRLTLLNAKLKEKCATYPNMHVTFMRDKKKT